MTEQQKEDLALLYQGEVFGEMFYCTLLRQFRTPVQQHLLGSLLQLESEEKRSEAAQFVRHVENMEWAEAAGRLIKISEDAVAYCRRIAATAPKEWKSLADAMVDHEVLILKATKLAANGEDERAADLVASHLAFPLPKPSTA